MKQDILQNCEINEYGQAVLSAQEYAEVVRELQRAREEVERLKGIINKLVQHLPNFAAKEVKELVDKGE